MFSNHWKRRAEAAEQLVSSMREELDGIEIRMADRACLISITREGKGMRWLFIRNGQTYLIETYSTLADNPDQWRKDLLERVK